MPKMEIKAALICIAKNENNYIREWCEYHHALGFDKIYIYDNNSGEYISDAVGDLPYVSINTRYRNVQQKCVEVQLKCYNEWYEKHRGEYTHFAFFDVDEYLAFSDKYAGLKEYIKHIGIRANAIKFFWKCHGDNGQLKYENKPLRERFPKVSEPKDGKYYYKMLLSTTHTNFKMINVHYPTPLDYVVNCNGNRIQYHQMTYSREPAFGDAWIDHYITKSTEEFFKNKRGKKDDARRLTVKLYYNYNEKTAEKDKYISELLGSDIKGITITNGDCPQPQEQPKQAVDKNPFQTPFIEPKPEIIPTAQYNEPKPTAVQPAQEPLQQNNDSTDGISVCISAYHTQNYIEECLDSIMAQTWFKTHSNWEVLLGIDGCEETLTKVKGIMHKYKNLRVFMMDKNVGTYVTCNTIIQYAKYKWLQRFDSDDVMMPNMLEELMKCVQGNNAGILLPYCFDFPNRPKILHIGEGQMMILRQAFLDYGGFYNYRCGSDTEIRKRLEGVLGTMDVKHHLFDRRQHQDSLTKKRETGYSSEYRQKIKEYIITTSPHTPKIQYTTCGCTEITIPQPTETCTQQPIANTEQPNEQPNAPKGVISLTSWKARISTVHITIESLVKHCPDFRIVLVLSSDEFPQKEKALPQSIMKYVAANQLEILWVKRNYKALKKIIFTARKYPNLPVISADDDCRYICNYAQELYDKWQECPNDIIRYNMYNERDDWQYTQGPSTLYPPKYFKVIFEPIIAKLENGTIQNYMDDDTIMTRCIKNNKIHITHIYRGHKFCFKFHNEAGAMHNNKLNDNFKSCYE